MGIKSKSNTMNTPSLYTVEGLIFYPKSGYYTLKNLNNNAPQLVDAIKAGTLDMKEFFGRFDQIKVKETHVDAAVESFEFLFPNITKLISINDRDYFKTELDFGDNFYKLIDMDFFDV